jgi:hypothetical protein
MSANYYLDAPHNEAGHLGKWAAGYFTAKAPEGVNSFDEWAAQLQVRRIFAERAPQGLGGRRSLSRRVAAAAVGIQKYSWLRDLCLLVLAAASTRCGSWQGAQRPPGGVRAGARRQPGARSGP